MFIHKDDAVVAGKPADSPAHELADGVGGAGCNRNDRTVAEVHTHEADSSRGGVGYRAVIEACHRALVGPYLRAIAFRFVLQLACDTPSAA